MKEPNLPLSRDLIMNHNGEEKGSFAGYGKGGRLSSNLDPEHRYCKKNGTNGKN